MKILGGLFGVARCHLMRRRFLRFPPALAGCVYEFWLYVYGGLELALFASKFAAESLRFVVCLFWCRLLGLDV